MPNPSKTRAEREPQVTVSFSDSIKLIEEQVQWTPKGVCLMTKWFFAEGTEVEFAFDHQGERHCCTGIVVACHPLRRSRGPYYETILYFIDTPCAKLQKAASACRLSRNLDGVAARVQQQSPALDGARASARPRPRQAL